MGRRDVSDNEKFTKSVSFTRGKCQHKRMLPPPNLKTCFALAAPIVTSSLLMACCTPVGKGYKPVLFKGNTQVVPTTSLAVIPPENSFWLVADSQIHHVTGKYTRLNSALADKYISTAVHHPVLDLWSSVALESAMADAVDAPVFFLGDAANMSCTDEYVRFVQAMGTKSPWFAIPGNHDGFMMGNFGYAHEYFRQPNKNTWQGGCDGGNSVSAKFRTKLHRIEHELFSSEKTANAVESADQGIMTKAQGILLYLNSLKTRNLIADDPLVASNWKPITLKKQNIEHTVEIRGRLFESKGQYTVGDKKYSVDIAAVVGIGQYARWKAYVTQAIELPDQTVAVLVDTNDVSHSPSLLEPGKAIPSIYLQKQGCGKSNLDKPFPSLCGQISMDQFERLDKMLKRQSAYKKFFLVGHHSWQELRDITLFNLQEFIRRTGFITYLSGHTHWSSAAVAYDKRASEINIASTTDWPMQYAKLSYLASEVAVEVFQVTNRSKYRCPFMPRQRYEIGLARGLFYGEKAHESYITEALSAYDSLFNNLLTSNHVGPIPENLVQALQDSRKKVQGGLSGSLDRKRRVLDELMKFDKDILRSSPDIGGMVHSMELDCVIEASKVDRVSSPSNKLDKSRALKRKTRFEFPPK